MENATVAIMLMNRFRRLLSAALLATPVAARGQDPYALKREHLVQEIVAETRATATDTGRAELSETVERALRTVPRHRFVPPDLVADAYRDNPLPIGLGQTISQPFIVALMTELCVPRLGRACSRSGLARATRPRSSRSASRACTPSRSCDRSASGPAPCWPSWATATSTCASATAIRDGPTPRPSTRSSSPPRPTTSRSR